MMDFSYIRKIGRFQWMCILLFGITCGINVQTNMSILFVAPKIDSFCDDGSSSFQKLTWEQQERIMTAFGRCNRPDLDLSEYTHNELVNMNTSSLNASRKCDTGYVYDHKDYDYTATEQYDLVCDRKWLIPMTKTVYMLGYFFGAIGSGAVSDRFGRKTAVIIFAAAVAVFNVMSAFSPIVEVFLLARCLVGASSIAYYTQGLILNTELVRKDERKVPRTVLSVSIVVLMMSFVGITVVLRDHRYLQSYIAIAMGISTVLLWFVLPESPRWLTAESRHEEAEAIVYRIAKFNKWSNEELNHLLVRETKHDDMERHANITDLFRTPTLRKRIMTLCAVWFAHIMTFYALIYNLGSFYPDLRLSLLFSTMVELPFFLVPMLLIDVVGRQTLQFSFMAVGGIFCLIMAPFMGGKGSITLLVLALVGKLAVVSQFFVGYIYTQELMPTVIRSQGIGLASTISRIGGMIAPQIALLDDLWPASSVVTLGIVALIGAGLSLLLPDTTGAELRQSIADGENFKSRHVYKFDLPKRRKKAYQSNSEKNKDEVETVNESNGEMDT